MNWNNKSQFWCELNKEENNSDRVRSTKDILIRKGRRQRRSKKNECKLGAVNKTRVEWRD